MKRLDIAAALVLPIAAAGGAPRWPSSDGSASNVKFVRVTCRLSGALTEDQDRWP
ncbi:MAG: hypothetical protein L0Y66_27365 [Myxococcaceae bacterium]|nr:hypothetical protein [Myxococcaceae bacterium]MCI0672365.1 hypothetical protein [Myxococcaceae bacterium]